MGKYYIQWEARGVQGFDEIEAASLEEAQKIAYDAAFQDFEMSVDYVAKTREEAVRDGDLDDDEEDNQND